MANATQKKSQKSSSLASNYKSAVSDLFAQAVRKKAEKPQLDAETYAKHLRALADAIEATGAAARPLQTGVGGMAAQSPLTITRILIGDRSALPGIADYRKGLGEG